MFHNRIAGRFLFRRSFGASLTDGKEQILGLKHAIDPKITALKRTAPSGIERVKVVRRRLQSIPAQ